MMTTLMLAATLFFAGDSTLDDYGHTNRWPYASWGTELEKSMVDGCRVDNHARGGRSTKSFVDEGRWERMIALVRPGDFVAFAFGHNDQKTEPRLQGRLYAPPQGLYKEVLRRFVRETRAKGATPIVMTPIVRATFDKEGRRLVERGDAKGEALADYAQAAREVAAETGSDLVDMYRLTHDLLERLGKDEAHKLFVISTGYRKSKDGEPVKDVTHPAQAGAVAFSKLFLEDVKSRKLGVTRCFR